MNDMKFDILNIKILFLVLTLSTGCSYSQDIEDFEDLRKGNICDYNINKLIKMDSDIQQLKKFMSDKGHYDFDADFDLFLMNISSSQCFDFRNDYGIYVFGEMSSHSIIYLWFKSQNGTNKIVDSKSSKSIIQELYKFYEMNKGIDEKEHIKILFGITKYLNQENEYPIPKECITYSWQCSGN